MIETIKNDQELYDIKGGFNLTSSVLNAIVSGARIVLELGRSLGSSLRRSMTKNICE